MKIFDISLPISAELPVYPGDAGVKVQPIAEIAKGSPYNLSIIRLGSHTGTHIDPPSHFVAGGASVDAIPLETFIGPAEVVELMDTDYIGAEQLSALSLPHDAKRILFKTRNSELWKQREFAQDFVYIRGDAAQWLVERGVVLVGIDYLSIEQFGAPEPVAHLTLLGAGIIAVEGLDLRDVPPGRYTLICLPIRVKDGDGAPARAVLLEEG